MRFAVGSNQDFSGFGIGHGGSAAASCSISAVPMPFSVSGNAPCHARCRARHIIMSLGYCRWVFFSPAWRTSPALNLPSRGDMPLRVTTHTAAKASVPGSPSNRSCTSCTRPVCMQRPGTASPHSVGRPFTTAMLCSDAIAGRPSSWPIITAMIASSARPLKSLGHRFDRVTRSQNTTISSNERRAHG